MTEKYAKVKLNIMFLKVIIKIPEKDNKIKKTCLNATINDNLKNGTNVEKASIIRRIKFRIAKDLKIFLEGVKNNNKIAMVIYEKNIMELL